MNYINLAFNPERIVNLNSLQNGGSGIMRSIKTSASTTMQRWYYYFIYINWFLVF